MSSDFFQNLNSLPESEVNKIIERLEFRNSNKLFAAMRDRYLNKIDLHTCDKVLDIGAGTGVVARAIAAMDIFNGNITALELNEHLLVKGQQLAAQEDIAQYIKFVQGDAENLQEDNDIYDVVIMHTVLSHLENPIQALVEALRVLKPQGYFVIFDADFSSCTFNTGETELDDEMRALFLDVFVANSNIMKQFPAMQKELNIKIVDYIPELMVEVGIPEYFYNFIMTYSQIALKLDLISEVKYSQRLDALNKCKEQSSFFGCCNFYSYIVKKL